MLYYLFCAVANCSLFTIHFTFNCGSKLFTFHYSLFPYYIHFTFNCGSKLFTFHYSLYL